jgi:hypothetical protein
MRTVANKADHAGDDHSTRQQTEVHGIWAGHRPSSRKRPETAVTFHQGDGVQFEGRQVSCNPELPHDQWRAADAVDAVDQNDVRLVDRDQFANDKSYAPHTIEDYLELDMSYSILFV